MSDEPPVPDRDPSSGKPLFLKPEAVEPEVVEPEVVKPAAAEPVRVGPPVVEPAAVEPEVLVDEDEHPEVLDPPTRPIARRPAPAGAPAERPVARRPAPQPTAVHTPMATRPSTRPDRVPTELPRAWWLLAVVEVTLIIVLLVAWLSGSADPPAGCSRSICSLGQGVAILSLTGALILGGLLVVSMLYIAVGAAQSNRRVDRGRQ